jgi:hypothetical protein
VNQLDAETRVARELRAQRNLADRQSAYMVQMTRCRGLLAALSAWADDMGDVIPDEVTWANVGDASKVACDLENVVAFLGLEVTTD